MTALRKSIAAAAVALTAVAIATTGLPTAAQADPPRWAPAHGYRAKLAHKHTHKARHRIVRRHHRRDAFRHGFRHNRRVVVVNRHYGAWSPDYRLYRGPSVDRGVLGGVLGGAFGALAGSNIGKGDGRTAAIIGGTVLGALIGSDIGRSLDRVDHAQVQRGLKFTPTGQTIAWNNPNTQTQYRMTPTRTYRAADNTYCRDYTTWGFVGGYEQQLHGTACRQTDGSWATVN
jgi:surface antigen